jgi:hypothetical protein
LLREKKKKEQMEKHVDLEDGKDIKELAAPL